MRESSELSLCKSCVSPPVEKSPQVKSQQVSRCSPEFRQERQSQKVAGFERVDLTTDKFE
jgi:hypothetical protein